MSRIARERYVHGYSAAVVHEMRSRDAEVFAAFLLPHLKPGMSLLDCGCGPGGITLGFRSRLGDGQLVGIDISEEQVELAKGAALDAGLDDVTFRTGDVYELPFEESAFDIVFSHTLLEHLSRPLDALVDMKRVLKPGGLLAVKNGDRGGRIVAPESPLLSRVLKLHESLAEKGGTDMNVGRMQHRLVRQAGFEQVTTTTSTHFYDSAGIRDRFAALARGWAVQVTDGGLMSESELAEALDEIDEFEADQDALVNLAVYWETLGTRPA